MTEPLENKWAKFSFLPFLLFLTHLLHPDSFYISTWNPTAIIRWIEPSPLTVIFSTDQVQSAVGILITITLANNAGGGRGAAPVASITLCTYNLEPNAHFDLQYVFCNGYVLCNNHQCCQICPLPMCWFPCSCCSRTPARRRTHHGCHSHPPRVCRLTPRCSNQSPHRGRLWYAQMLAVYLYFFQETFVIKKLWANKKDILCTFKAPSMY